MGSQLFLLQIFASEKSNDFSRLGTLANRLLHSNHNLSLNITLTLPLTDFSPIGMA